MISAEDLDQGDITEIKAGQYPDSLESSFKVVKTGDSQLKVYPFDTRGYAEIDYRLNSYSVTDKENWEDPWGDFVEPHLEELNPVAEDPESTAQMALQMAYEEALEVSPEKAVEKMGKAVLLAEELVGSFDNFSISSPPESRPNNAYFTYGNGTENLAVHFSEEDPMEELTGIMYATGQIALRESPNKPVVQTGFGHKPKEHHLQSEDLSNPHYYRALQELNLEELE